MDMSERNLFELLNIVVTKVGKKHKSSTTQILNPCIDMLHLMFIFNFFQFCDVFAHWQLIIPQGDLAMFGYKSAIKFKFFCIVTTCLNNA
jgi:hypothetical protein